MFVGFTLREKGPLANVKIVWFWSLLSTHLGLELSIII